MNHSLNLVRVTSLLVSINKTEVHVGMRRTHMSVHHSFNVYRGGHLNDFFIYLCAYADELGNYDSVNHL